MSDITVCLLGEREPVDRPFRRDGRADASLRFEAREYAAVTRVDGTVVSELRPGMLVCAKTSRVPDTWCLDRVLQHAAKLPLFYVSEFVQPIKDGEPCGQAEALVLRVREASSLLEAREREAYNLQPTDLIVGDQPFYLSIALLVAPVPAVVGQRDATGARRFLSCCAVDCDFKLRKVYSDIVPLTSPHTTALLDSYADVSRFLSPLHLAPSDEETTDAAALLPAAAVETATALHKKRNIEDISNSSDSDGTAFDADVAPAPIAKKSDVAAQAVATARPIVVVLPEVVACWATHRAALVDELHNRMENESADERQLDTSAAWRRACLCTDVGAELSALVKEVATGAESLFVEYATRLPLSMEHLALPFLRVITYLTLSQLVNTPRIIDAVPHTLQERINKRRQEMRAH